MAAPSHRARLTEMWKRPTGRLVYHIFHYSRKAFTYERSTEYGGFLGKFLQLDFTGYQTLY